MENKLKGKRNELGYTQAYVAQEAGIGRTYYTEIENGNRMGSLDVWLSIGRVLNIPESEIIAHMKERRRKKTA